MLLRKRVTPPQIQAPEVCKCANPGIPPVPAAVSSFLQLPGELRNHVYSYCCPEGPEKLRRASQRDSRPMEEGQVVRDRLFLSLSHVNRQIRKEFLPIYMQKFDHSITIADSSAYVQALPTLPTSIAGTITIDTEIAWYDPQGCRQPIDLAPLLRLRTKYKNIAIDIVPQEDQVPYYENPNRERLTVFLFSLLVGPRNLQFTKWLAYFSATVKELWISPLHNRDPYEVHIIVNPSCEEWWMGWDAPGPSIGRPTEMRDWAVRTGYPGAWGMNNLRVSVPQ